MNVTQLAEALEREGIKKDAYKLDCGLPNESYVLCNEGQFWTCYYSERGDKNEYKTFDTEHEACEYFFRLIMDDRTTRSKW